MAFAVEAGGCGESKPPGLLLASHRGRCGGGGGRGGVVVAVLLAVAWHAGGVTAQARTGAADRPCAGRPDGAGRGRPSRSPSRRSPRRPRTTVGAAPRVRGGRASRSSRSARSSIGCRELEQTRLARRRRRPYRVLSETAVARRARRAARPVAGRARAGRELARGTLTRARRGSRGTLAKPSTTSRGQWQVTQAGGRRGAVRRRPPRRGSRTRCASSTPCAGTVAAPPGRGAGAPGSRRAACWRAPARCSSWCRPTAARCWDSSSCATALPLWEFFMRADAWERVQGQAGQIHRRRGRPGAPLPGRARPRRCIVEVALFFGLGVRSSLDAAARGALDGVGRRPGRALPAVRPPWASAALLTLLIGALATPPLEPRAMRPSPSLAAVVPIVRLIADLATPALVPAVWVVGLFHVVDLLRALISSVPLLEQAVLLLQLLALVARRRSGCAGTPTSPSSAEAHRDAVAARPLVVAGAGADGADRRDRWGTCVSRA